MISRYALGCIVRQQFRRRTSNNVQRYLSLEFKTSPLRIGFVGLGNMGLPMSINLSKHGVDVLAFDSNAKAAEKAALAGIEMAESVEQIARMSEYGTVITMLPSCEAVDEVMQILMKNSQIDFQRTVIDCSTVSPMTSKKWHSLWLEQGHVMVDAPVSGGVKGATDGTLTFMVGSSSENDFQRALPFLERMGKRAIPCGSPGSGTATKLCNNVALAAQMLGICEAMNLGESLGVDPVVLADVMNISTAKCWSSEVNNPHPKVARTKLLDGLETPAASDYEGGFASKLMLKDLSLALGAAEQTNVSMPIAATTRQLYQVADLRGMGAQDFGVILRFLKGQ